MEYTFANSLMFMCGVIGILVACLVLFGGDDKWKW